MKKQPRRFVTIRKEERADNGKAQWVLTWFPRPNERKRKTFSDEDEAETEADRVESWLAKSRDVLLSVPPAELETAVMLRNELAPGIPLYDIVRRFADAFKSEGIYTSDLVNGMLLAQAGNEYIESRTDLEKFSKRHRTDVRQHINRLIGAFGHRPLTSITLDQLTDYVRDVVGGAPKTRWNHSTTLVAFGRWMREKKKWFPLTHKTAFEDLEKPSLSPSKKEIYTPDQMIRILAATPLTILQWVAMGAFAGIRAAERLRMTGESWQADNEQYALEHDVTKTNRRRVVGGASGMPNMTAWASLATNGDDTEFLVDCRHPYRWTPKIVDRTGIPWKHNALRSSFASYHLQKFKNPQLTSMLDGHSVEQLESSYKAIKGVNDKTAEAWGNITPKSVVDYCVEHGLPEPEWATRIIP